MSLREWSLSRLAVDPGERPRTQISSSFYQLLKATLCGYLDILHARKACKTALAYCIPDVLMVSCN